MQHSLKLAAALAAFVPYVSGQTYSKCNPLKESGCKPNPALCNLETNFKGASALPAGWSNTAGNIKFGADGAEFVVAKSGDAPTIQTNGYFQFGYVEVNMKSSKGVGIISSIVLQSEDLDEVDWEFTGCDNKQTQSNYFGQGSTVPFKPAGFHSPASGTGLQDQVHKYAVNWTQESVVWLIDDAPVRTLNFNDAQGGAQFPQTPMNVRLGIWAGGDTTLNQPGTVEWACGATDYTQGPFKMTVESVKVINYTPGKEYTYGDTTGKFSSIKTTPGECANKDGSGPQQPPQQSASSATAAAPSPSTTSTKDGIFAPVDCTTSTPSVSACGGTSTTTVTITEDQSTPSPQPPAQQSSSVVVPPVSVTSAATLSTITPGPTGPGANGTVTTSAPLTSFTGAAARVGGSDLFATGFFGAILAILAL